MQSILVTGGAGFIGSNLVRMLLGSTDERVVVLDKLSYAGNLASLPLDEYPDRLAFVHGSIGDAELVQSLLAKHSPNSVFHLAAESHVDRSIDVPDEFITTNIVGTGTLLKRCLYYWEQADPTLKDEFRFIHVSTDEVYGSLGATGLFTEQSPIRPSSPYAASKAASDHLVRAYHRTYGLPVLIGNCSNNYGPYQFPEKLIPLITVAALEGRPLPVYGDGLHVRDWLYVDDNCRALWMLAEKGRLGEVYNIGGNCEQQNIDVVRSICIAIDEMCPNLTHRPCESLIEYVADRPGHDRRYAIDISKIGFELGWQPEVAFEEGIRQTVEWYLNNRQWIKAVSGSNAQKRRGLRRPASTD